MPRIPFSLFGRKSHSKGTKPPNSEAPPIDTEITESSVGDKSSAELSHKDELDIEASSSTTPPVVPIDEARSDKVLEEWAKHYSNQFWTGANRTNTILVAWAASLALILIAIIPLYNRAARYDQSYTKYEESRQSLAKEKAERLAEVSRRKRAAEEQIENPEAIGSEETEAERAGRLGNARQQMLALTDISKELKEEFKDRETKLDNQFRAIRSLKSDLMPFSVPFGKLDIGASYSPLVWILLFACFLFYFFYKRLMLIGAMAEVLHIELDLRGRSINDVKGLGHGAPFWIAPLPDSCAGSRISIEDLRKFLGWEPRAITRSTLTYVFLATATVLYVGVAILSIQVVKIYDNPQMEMALWICLTGTLALLVVTGLAWLQPNIRLDKYPESLIDRSRRRQILTGALSSIVVMGVVYFLAPRKAFPRALVLKSKRSRKLADSRRDQRKPVPLKTGFQLHNKSNVVHYVTTKGRSKSLNSKMLGKRFTEYRKDDVVKLLNPEPLKPASQDVDGKEKKQNDTVGNGNAKRGRFTQEPSPASGQSKVRAIALEYDDLVAARNAEKAKQSLKGLRLASVHVKTTAEILAIEKTQAGDVSSSMKILWTGIQSGTNGKANYRLYDLLAQLSLQHSQTEDLKNLIDYVANNNPELETRIKKWQDPLSAWAMRVKNGKAWKTAPNVT